jgi:hypothetical protein
VGRDARRRTGSVSVSCATKSISNNGSLRAVAAAPEAEIAALPGFGPALARKVLQHARGEAPAGEPMPGGASGGGVVVG